MAYHLAAKANEYGALGVAGLPGIALVEPVVGNLDLTAALDLLAKQAVVVTHTVTKSENPLGCHRVEEACGQASQTAVTQARIALFCQQVVELDAHRLQALFYHVMDADRS